MKSKSLGVHSAGDLASRASTSSLAFAGEAGRGTKLLSRGVKSVLSSRGTSLQDGTKPVIVVDAVEASLAAPSHELISGMKLLSRGVPGGEASLIFSHASHVNDVVCKGASLAGVEKSGTNCESLGVSVYC
eukprot:CAMPEP_0170628330 /NCGR_PEP_ID=MMETSP0224-20130122/32609_1 /TAXON_ID=285029 /ORGANISM="Togula jolla, Strain CCCM 725" /LENGTH=130 /DNA_ID=CAMNT_0010955713 /DNA_START=29 /DNA_END=421 /DNA_ORIENTATION=-